MTENVISRFVLAVLLLIAPVASAQWISLGPDGGDARSLAFDPQNPDHILLGTAAGQLFESRDGGSNWSRLARVGTDDYVLDNIKFDPKNPKVIYAAAWSVTRQTDAGDLFRSTDGGRTWRELPGMRHKSIRALAIAPSDSRVLFVGALDGVHRSKNGGDTWELISPPGHPDIRNIESLAVDPNSADIVYAGTWHLGWKTTDGGKNWKPIKNGVIDDSDVFSIIVDRLIPSTIYLSACSGIYKSENSADLFRKVQGIPASARRTRVLQQDPNNNQVVYAGTTEGLWRTMDAGKTWRRLTGANIIVNDVLVDPRNSNRVLVATDRSGVLASIDGGATFTASNRGFTHRVVSTVLADRFDSRTFYAGVVNDKEFGGVLVSRDRGLRWAALNAGLAGRDVFTLKQTETGTLVAGTNRGIFFLPRNGSAWSPLNTVVREKVVPVATRNKSKSKKIAVVKTRTEFVKSELAARVAHVEQVGKRLVAATSEGLFSSDDLGKTWRPITTAGKQHYVAVAAHGSMAIAASLNGVATSFDGGETWNASRLPSFITTVYSATTNGKVMWLGTRDGAFRSTDGVNWDKVLGGLPSRNIVHVLFEPASGTVFATSRDGEFYSSRDGGSRWSRQNTGFAVRSVASLGRQVVALSTFDGILAQPEPEQRGGGGESFSRQ
ncbi:MAG TPA: transcriptional regulator [Candidatus Nanoarchaeia archaeon]|nr:transcriptional regulator [Candidatus Nanoarchaeia archaeon]